jgi:hypothetical protein
MNFKTTIVLLVALVVVGIMFYFNMNRPSSAVPDQEQPAAAGEGPKIIKLSGDDVTSITITDSGGNRTAVHKDGATWQMTEPVSAGVVDWQTTDLIRTICDLRSQGRPDASPGDSGLNTPSFKVDLLTSDGRSTRLVLGAKTGIGDDMYAQVDGGDVNLVDSSLAKSLKTAANDLRDKHLLPQSTTADFKQITIETPGQTLKVVKSGDKWAITSPVQIPGDTDSITSLTSAITGAEATEFVDQNSDEAAFEGFNHPTMKITLSTEAPSMQPSTEPSVPLTLTVGSADSLSRDHYFVQTSDGLVGKIDRSTLESLQKTPLDLRDREVIADPPAEVSKISLVKAIYPTASSTQPSNAVQRPTFTQLIVLERRAPKIAALGPKPKATTAPSTQPNSTWMFAIPKEPDKQVDDVKVDAVLEKFNPFRADKYLASAPTTAVEQRYVVTLESPSLKKYHVEIVRPAGGGTPYAEYGGLTFEIPSTILDALDVDFHKTP